MKRITVVCERSETITSVRNVPERNEKGRQYRQYFLDLEKAWNTPEQIFARALKMAIKRDIYHFELPSSKGVL